jgi:hypothetical protein
MSSMDKHLDRLLKAAAAAPMEAPQELPFAVEARVLAHWRASQTVDAGQGVLRLFRLGLACAGTLMVAAAVVSLIEIRQTSADQWDLPNATVNMALMR